ncbi:hypothetical protein AGMMS50256_36080 [Betaproteobacteria bacterium]|nr:hypothetical protein AGMMS50256_36080 [Betaproteobacteria bacterium]
MRSHRATTRQSANNRTSDYKNTSLVREEIREVAIILLLVNSTESQLPCLRFVGFS